MTATLSHKGNFDDQQLTSGFQNLTVRLGRPIIDRYGVILIYGIQVQGFRGLTLRIMLGSYQVWPLQVPCMTGTVLKKKLQ